MKRPKFKQVGLLGDVALIVVFCVSAAYARGGHGSGHSSGHHGGEGHSEGIHSESESTSHFVYHGTGHLTAPASSASGVSENPKTKFSVLGVCCIFAFLAAIVMAVT